MEIAAPKKIITGGFLAAPEPYTECNDADEVDNDDDPINRGKLSGGEHGAFWRAADSEQGQAIHRLFAAGFELTKSGVELWWLNHFNGTGQDIL